MKQIHTTRRRLLALASISSVLALAGCGGVQGGSGGNGGGEGFPSGAVEFTLPSSPGGSTDLIGRAVAKALTEPLGATVTPVNKPGANGAVGGKEALAKQPDGQSIVMLFQSLMAITPLAVTDSEPITFDQMDVLTGLTVEDYVLVVNTEDAPATDLEELLSTPDLSYGTAGVGTGGQLAQAVLLEESGVKYRDVPFEGGSPAVTALLGSQVDAITVQLAEAMPHIESGDFTALATFNEERSEFLPDVPTATESGYDVVVDQKRFVAAPVGLPQEVKDVYADAFAQAFADEAYGSFLEDNYISRWEVSGDEVETTITQAAETFKAKVDEFGLNLGGQG